MSDTSANDVLDEGLARLAPTGPEFRGGLSNHGPMAAEALVRLGRADAVEHWLDGYLRKLDDRARARRPGHRPDLARGARRAQPGRRLGGLPPRPAGRRALARRPRPLVAAAAARRRGRRHPRGHPHLARRPQPGRRRSGRTRAAGRARRDELGPRAAYWAASYLELPGRPRPAADLDLAAAVARPAGRCAEPPGRADLRPAQGGLAGQPGFGAARRRAAAARPTRPTACATWRREFAAGLPGLRARAGRSRCCTRSPPRSPPARCCRCCPPSSRGPPTTPCGRWRPRCTRSTPAGVTPEPLPAGPAPVAGRRSPTARSRPATSTPSSSPRPACGCTRETPDPVFLHAAARASELLGGA